MDLKDFQENILPIKNRLYRFALRVVTDPVEAEDVVQEVLIKVWKNREKLNEVTNVEAWCLRVTKNLCIDKLRSKHKRVVSFETETSETLRISDKGANPYQIASMKDTFQYIQNLMNKLPEKQKVVMHLRDIEEMTYKEIADALDISLNQVKINLFRARKEIKGQLVRLKIVEK
jgi:RNA polymerase sigma-70 factor, ECF subfamily